MSLKDVTPGRYKAKAVEGVWTKIGEKQTPAVGVKFTFVANNSAEEIWHIMYLTETPLKNGLTVQDMTFNTLAMLGYDETQELTPRDGSQYFDVRHLADKEVELVIELQPDQRDATKTYTKVRYVNELGGNRFSGLGVEQTIGQDKLKSAMAAARARIGASNPQAKTEDVPW